MRSSDDEGDDDHDDHDDDDDDDDDDNNAAQDEDDIPYPFWLKLHIMSEGACIKGLLCYPLTSFLQRCLCQVTGGASPCQTITSSMLYVVEFRA